MPTRKRSQIGALLLIALISFASGLPMICRADPAQDPPPLTLEEEAMNQRHLEMLRSGRFEQLDKEMNQIQMDFERGLINDVALQHLFRAFFDPDPTLETLYKDWVGKFPRSYAAHEAQGIYYRRVGFQARGTRYASETSSKQFEVMAQNLELAAKSHRQAYGLTEKPLMTCYDLLSIAKLSGDRAGAQQALDRSIRIAPTNYIARYKYMMMLEGRWGGNLEEMRNFRVESKKSGVPESLLRYFDDLITKEMAWQRELKR